jgi:hypothetical protein
VRCCSILLETEPQVIASRVSMRGAEGDGAVPAEQVRGILITLDELITDQITSSEQCSCACAPHDRANWTGLAYGAVSVSSTVLYPRKLYKHHWTAHVTFSVILTLAVAVADLLTGVRISQGAPSTLILEMS